MKGGFSIASHSFSKNPLAKKLLWLTNKTSLDVNI